MAAYEFDPSEKQIEDYIPYLSGMNEKEFKELISEVKQLVTYYSSKIIPRNMYYYIAPFSCSPETLSEIIKIKTCYFSDKIRF